MKNSKVLKAVLIISGLIMVGIGAAKLIAPVAFLGTNGIELGGQINLLSEIRAAGGAVLASGIVVISGVFVTKLTFTSTIISALMFLSYGIARILSMAIDGMPAKEVLAATAIEVIIGLSAFFALLKYRERI